MVLRHINYWRLCNAKSSLYIHIRYVFFFVADLLLVGQLCANPKSERSLLSCLKVTQCSTSEIGDPPLYISCSLPIQVMTTGPLPAPSKSKSGRFNACGHSSTHRMTLWRLWSGRTPPGRPGQRSSSKRSWQSLMKLPILQIARYLGVSHTTVNACVKEHLKRRSYRRHTSQILTEKTKSLRLINPSCPLLPRPEPAGLLRLVLRREYHQHDLPQHQSQPDRRHSPKIRQEFAELPLALVEKACSSSRSASRRWLRLKAATLNRCQLYYIIKLPELIFSIKVLK